MLSSDLSTLFTGRFIEIPVYPFIFSEYCEYYGYNSNTANVLDSYVMNGGLAGSYVYSQKEEKSFYIKDVYTTIIKRDLVYKYGIKEEAMLDSLTDYMMDNISDPATIERELSPLRAIKDAYPKVLIANTSHDDYDIEGIIVLDIARWLLR